MRFDLEFDVAGYRRAAHADIDRQAGKRRALFITNVTGQEMVYQEKRREAEAYMANTSISPELIPHLVSEAAAMNDTVMNVAATILTMSEQWGQVSSLIEARRLLHKQMVSAATTAAAIDAAAQIDWSDIEAMA